MNKDRRKRLSDIVERLSGIHTDLEELATDERDAFESMPEGLQQSTKGEQIDANADALENASCTVDDLNTELQEIEQS
jgi:N6-adenosine-specific RNA methylase IME4